MLTIPTINSSNPITNTYIVQRGDSLWTIANKNNITVDELKKTNNLTDNTLTIGQVLIIPSSNNQAPPSEDNNVGYETTYIVKRGDSLWSIANNYGITVKQLKEANDISNNMLTVGQELIIPVSLPNNTPTTTTTYTVKRGDSLWLIANNYNTTVDNLKLLNNLSNNLLTIGQELIVPVN
ncbi:MAG: LysM peptidoglycan-binding domain-containing protein [bacterium]|nr:LysM peptidoglycan-binding domain-containing protein [bacterium]